MLLHAQKRKHNFTRYFEVKQLIQSSVLKPVFVPSSPFKKHGRKVFRPLSVFLTEAASEGTLESERERERLNSHVLFVVSHETLSSFHQMDLKSAGKPRTGENDACDFVIHDLENMKYLFIQTCRSQCNFHYPMATTFV